MYTTHTSGYYYTGRQLAARPTRAAGRAKLVRVAVLAAAIGLSVLFGAMMHAYATGGDQDNSRTGPAQTNAAEERLVEAEPAYLPYIVVSGDSLWRIAKQHLPAGMDIRNYINEIKAMNGLQSTIIHEGQLLQVPLIR